MKTSQAPPVRVMRVISRVNVAVYRLTGGRVMGTLNGCPICLVTMTGARSGKRITLPLMCTQDGDDVILVASMGGAPKNPPWYYNLKAHPEIEIQLGSHRRAMRAAEADDEQRERLWPVAVRAYPPFAEYQERTTRRIPIFVCSPA
ncbi:nitroreductase family deazaflavin-dependent oxidoreductase [Lentzea sp. BCCO 10_0856]|uniref:Nitroreductase family deazaflavin-dependent oxidoreductase n=1 Tax=Lentzea miocenica TaxID=3095431 RepID=A0ABU4T0Y2_9PSEU|nr:nitroreductase family deazaflavin-dependent oxidoreductase [Lentzea sp. BCCO 10_0856]MDX8031819.1 nitroreductase family deazaflavin-dependent oxidoreductase [Lentzea sp. BCCO 10_0856]